ncbi:MAG: MMPL family transporter, partial [Actinomycetota bacterium]|nr:MMPL family transporter [Actinomycetota bacterium]
TEISEAIGLTAAVIILLFAFGTVTAMAMPIVTAVLGLACALSIIRLLEHVLQVPAVASTLATMIGLGVGIDYALFMVSRYRSERAEGLEIPDAVARATATSGTAIVFAGGTVVIALVTLLVAGIPLVTSLGYASAFAVLTAVLASITLLPATLALVGRHIDSLALPAFMRPKQGDPEKGFWGGWSRFVTGHPKRAIALALLVLLPLIVPFFSLQLGQEDIGATPKDTTERQAYDLLASGFGPGYTGPLLIAVDLGSPAEPSATFEKQYAQAQSLQAELENEQLQGQTQAASLQNSAEELEAEGARLLAEKAALEAEGAGLKGEKAQLKRSAAAIENQRTIVAQLKGLVGEAAELVELGAALTAQAAVIVSKLEKVRAAQAVTEEQLAQPQTPAERVRLEARLAALQRRQAGLEAQFADTRAAQSALRKQADALRRKAEKLRDRASRLGAETLGLASEAADAAVEAIGLVGQKNKLQLQAANAKVEAAQLQTQQAQLEALQEQAQTQQAQAEKLQSTLTAELTAAGGDERGTDPRLVALQDALAGTIGVELVSPPQINDEGDAAIYTVIPDGDPADEKTAELVTTIREYVIPQSTAGTDLETHVGGQTASYVDLAAAISDKLFLVILAVNALGFLVLLMAFRSIVVSAQAVAAIALSVCAAFGVVTACFQFGWGLDLVGLETASGEDPIASFVPLIMFAVLFGLSMDYQVFLMSQIEQARAKVKSDREAIALGLATGARVISAAALIMIAVFGSFILNGDPTVKQFGVGLAVGVALAAMSVLLLAPALLVLAGKNAWWVPAWADRFLPKIDIEGAHLDEGAPKGPTKPPKIGPMKL